MDVVELGCERLTFAADAMNVLIRELKLNCNEGNKDYTIIIINIKIWGSQDKKLSYDVYPFGMPIKTIFKKIHQF